MKKWLHRVLKSPKLRSGLGIIITAAVLLELISAVQYLYSHRALERELEHRAETELTLKAIIIKGTLNKTEQMLKDYSWNIAESLNNPDLVDNELKFLVKANPDILSAGVAFVPEYYPDKGRWHEPFAKMENGEPTLRQIAGPHHDYTWMEFYTKPLESAKPNWTDPYIDEFASSGEDTLITTHSMPIYDRQGKQAGVFAIDVSLDWLSDTLNARHAYPSSFDLLLTEGGTLVCHPKFPHPNAEDVDQVHQLINDSSVVRRMSTSGRSKIIDFRSLNDGDKGYIFYANMRGKPHWQLSVVCYEKEVYGTLKHMRRLLMLSMLAALGLLGFIVFRTARSERRLRSAAIERERIDGQLRIARDLQMSMLPDENTASRERTDVDVRGSLVPAVAVGGDLYDYFIRDEKLYFAIGDVSGKGVPSSLLMAVARALFNSVASRDSNPSRIMQLLNENACRNNTKNMFATFFIGVLDLPTGRLRYCNAGHDVPVLVNGEPATLPVKANLPLGVMEDFKFEGEEIQLEYGTTLFLYTDGLTEAMDGAHNQFGLHRVFDTLEVCGPDSTPAEILSAMNTAVQDFVEGAPQSDDLTMLTIRYTPVQEKEVLHDTLTLENDVKRVTELNSFVESVTSRLSLEASMAQQVKLAVEEAVVNVMNYAYPIGTSGEITIEAQASTTDLRFIITDKGKPFDPTEAPAADTTLNVEDRSIGGLGIFLVRELMDSINYERADGQNILTLKKQYKPSK